ncbi:Golgi-associated plant pathogenesis-related protein 1, partial [Habropoda laboriosa]
GHFTQLIWASSRYFGVGKARSRSGKIIVVANYRPVGNISGQFQNNVLPPLPENINLSSPRQPFAKVFRVASDSPPPTSSSSFVQPLSTDSDRSSVSSAQ